MTDQEKRDIADRLSNGSRRVTFESALRLVEMNPDEAVRLIRDQEEREKKRRERKRALRELHSARVTWFS
ncbi:MAG TPA: hypothetical protein VG448_07395 [Solirubrobacterales bacterium]|nr:hypothetical protein [Solirubrobacterales bacterium]